MLYIDKCLHEESDVITGPDLSSCTVMYYNTRIYDTYSLSQHHIWHKFNHNDHDFCNLRSRLKATMTKEIAVTKKKTIENDTLSALPTTLCCLT